MRPRTIRFRSPLPPTVLAVGGQFKATFALGRGRHAFLSHHLGDLDHYEAYRAVRGDDRPLRAAASDFAGSGSSTTCTRTTPRRDTRDRAAQGSRRSPGRSSTTTRTWRAAWPSNGLDGPVIGVTFDGTGYGTDGAIWGGEFLVGDYRRVPPRGPPALRRHARRRAAVREPWRMAVAHLRRHAGRAPPSERRPTLPAATLRTVRADDRATAQHAADLERGPALRRRGGPGWRLRPRQLRGPGGDGAGVAGRRGVQPPTEPIPSMLEPRSPKLLDVDTRPLDRRGRCGRAAAASRRR